MKTKASTKKMVLYYAQKYAIPYELLMGTYTLETTYRKWYHRFAENSLVVFSAFLNFLFRKRIRNFTIGKCQVGLATILSHCGIPRYRHCAVIDKLTFKELGLLIRAMKMQGSLDCCAWALSGFYQDEMTFTNSIHSAIVSIGERYNGTYTYGVLLDIQFSSML
ncbi:MAG: hypothetical protein RR313_11090 [Anaerovoracaceae bacterium]